MTLNNDKSATEEEIEELEKAQKKAISGDSFDILGDTTYYDADFGINEEELLPPEKLISDKGYIVVTKKDQKSHGVSLTEGEIKAALEKMAESNTKNIDHVV